MIPLQHCPSCGANASQSLGNLLQSTEVDYFICGSCAHLWEVPKAIVRRTDRARPVRTTT